MRKRKSLHEQSIQGSQPEVPLPILDPTLQDSLCEEVKKQLEERIKKDPLAK